VPVKNVENGWVNICEKYEQLQSGTFFETV